MDRQGRDSMCRGKGPELRARAFGTLQISTQKVIPQRFATTPWQYRMAVRDELDRIPLSSKAKIDHVCT